MNINVYVKAVLNEYDILESQPPCDEPSIIYI